MLITREMPEISERVRLPACVEYLEQPKAKRKEYLERKSRDSYSKKERGAITGTRAGSRAPAAGAYTLLYARYKLLNLLIFRDNSIRTCL